MTPPSPASVLAGVAVGTAVGGEIVGTAVLVGTGVGVLVGGTGVGVLVGTGVGVLVGGTGVGVLVGGTGVGVLVGGTGVGVLVGGTGVGVLVGGTGVGVLVGSGVGVLVGSGVGVFVGLGVGVLVGVGVGGGTPTNTRVWFWVILPLSYTSPFDASTPSRRNVISLSRRSTSFGAMTRLSGSVIPAGIDRHRHASTSSASGTRCHHDDYGPRNTAGSAAGGRRACRHRGWLGGR